MKVIDLTGKKFGNLTVLKPEGKDKFGETIWHCRCDCGNSTNVRGHKLRSGLTKSCGCLKFKPNRYDLSGEYGICYFNNGGYFIFDKEDYEKIIVEQVGIDKAFSVIDELMELLYVENRPLYESVMRKIEY